MRIHRIAVSVQGALLFLSAAAFVGVAAEEKAKPVEKFSAVAISMGTGKSSRLDITINRWSTD